MRFGEYIRQCREHMGLTLKELAEALSVDVPMLSRYERSLRPVKEEHLSILSKKLNVDFDSLRNLWVADKVLAVVIEEKYATDILNIVVDNIIEKGNPNDES